MRLGFFAFVLVSLSLSSCLPRYGSRWSICEDGIFYGNISIRPGGMFSHESARGKTPVFEIEGSGLTDCVEVSGRIEFLGVPGTLSYFDRLERVGYVAGYDVETVGGDDFPSLRMAGGIVFSNADVYGFKKVDDVDVFSFKSIGVDSLVDVSMARIVRLGEAADGILPSLERVEELFYFGSGCSFEMCYDKKAYFMPTNMNYVGKLVLDAPEGHFVFSKDLILGDVGIGKEWDDEQHYVSVEGASFKGLQCDGCQMFIHENDSGDLSGEGVRFDGDFDVDNLLVKMDGGEFPVFSSDVSIDRFYVYGGDRVSLEDASAFSESVEPPVGWDYCFYGSDECNEMRDRIANNVVLR